MLKKKKSFISQILETIVSQKKSSCLITKYSVVHFSECDTKVKDLGKEEIKKKLFLKVKEHSIGEVQM